MRKEVLHTEGAATAAWERDLEQLLDAHFVAAHGRVDEFYRCHFLSLKAVLRRHWRHRRDIPRDLANVPRLTWGLLRRLLGSETASSPRFSGKELALADAVAVELLDLPGLEKRLLTLLERHPSLPATELQALRDSCAGYSDKQLRDRVRRAVNQLSITQEGGRDVMLFLSLGLAGRALSDKIAFGTAGILGSAAATSLYIGQQSFIGALWTKWFGAPAWVSTAGAVAGFLLLMLLAPVAAPFLEVGVNRLRAKTFLHDTVERVHRQMLEPGADAYSLAGYLGTYVQLLPDLLVALRALR